MAEKIRLNTGVKTFEVYDTDDNFLGTFRFVPTDTDILKRHAEVKAYLSTVAEQLGTDDSVEILNEINEKIREKMDYLFHAPVSESFFRHAAPLTLLDSGENFASHILSVLGEIIERESHARGQKQQELVEEYVKKYAGK